MRYFVVTISVAIVSAAVAALLYFWLAILVANHDKEIVANQKKIQSYGQDAIELQSLLNAKSSLPQRRLAVERLTTQIAFNADLLSEYSFLIPKNVFLTELRYSREEKKIEVKGHSLTEVGVSQFIDNLSSSIHFRQVLQRTLMQDLSAGSADFTFSLDCMLRNGH